MLNALEITSPSFTDEGKIPKRHTGFGGDISPELDIDNICEAAVSLAVVMDDLDIPMTDEFNHWVIWNIPKTAVIPENIPHSAVIAELGGAVQGVGYGKNQYAGPKQPFFIRNRHRYRFTVYALDCTLELPRTAGKAELVRAMEGHILQSGSITGTYKRGES